MPAVSGSSGRLIISSSKDDAAEQTWPGRVFEDPALDYTAAMHAFVAASLPDAQPVPPPESPVQAEKVSRRAQKRQLRQERLALREARRQTLRLCDVRRETTFALAVIVLPPHVRKA